MSRLIWALCVVAALVLSADAANSSAPSPTPNLDFCDSVAMGMIACENFVTLDSNMTAPDAACCVAVTAVVKLNPICLCEAKKMAADMGLNVSQSRSDSLPKLCSVPVPDNLPCKSSSPTPAPAPSAPVSPPTPTPTPSPSAPVSPPPSIPAPVSPPPVPAPVSSPPSPSAVVPQAPAPAPATSSSLKLSSSVAALLFGLAVATGF